MSYDSNTAKLIQCALQAAHETVGCLRQADTAMAKACSATTALYLCADERGQWDLTDIIEPLTVTLAKAIARRDALEVQWTAACQVTP